ncbi:MAG: glycosyltransferase [Candidatus Aenigmatarchaeota archaeon]
MKPGRELVSVIIPFRDNVSQVKACIASLKRQPYKNIEMILVSDRVKWKDRGKRVKAVYDPSFGGVGEKRNAGAKRARGDIMFFLDSDCTVRPDAITTLVRMFGRLGADAISGMTPVPNEGNLVGIATGLEYEDRFLAMGENFVDIAATTCLGVRKAAYDFIGGFKDYSVKEAIGEDWDFSRKLTAAGFRIFHTNRMQVYHNHTNDTLKKWFQRRVEHSGYRVTHKHKHGQLFEQYFTLRMFVETSLLFSVPVALRIYLRTGKWQALTLPVFAILRNIAWFTGVVKELVL